MAKNLLVINVDIRETRVALIENGIIAELHIERDSSESTLGNIYVGKVTRVLPGMQAAFIDVGLERAAFLHVEDLIRPDDFEAYLAGERGRSAQQESERNTAGGAAHGTNGEAALPDAAGDELEDDGEQAVPPPVDADADGPPDGERDSDEIVVAPRVEVDQPADERDDTPLEDADDEELVARGETHETDEDAEPDADEVEAEDEGPDVVDVDTASGGGDLDAPGDGARDDDDDDDAEPKFEVSAEVEGVRVEAVGAVGEAVAEVVAGERVAEPDAATGRARSRMRRRRGRVRRSGRTADRQPDGVRAAEPKPEPRQDGRRDGRGGGNRDKGDRRQRGQDRQRGGREKDALRLSKTTPIRDVVREGQEVVVQISKEPIGSKGARVTSHVSLPGRYVVYLPTVEHVGISKRIGSDRERSRLREAIDSMKPPKGGIIVRTLAEGLTKKQLKSDVGYLVRLWGEVAKKRETAAKAPACIYQELDLITKTARDLFTDDIEKIVIDDREQYGRLRRFVEMFMPERANDVEYYDGAEPIFDAYGIEDEIARALARKVPLTSGGHLIIDQAEALTAIDVNTGRFVGKGSKDLEDTILKTNLEAVEEIAYQLRFRNIGGLIVLDLIDMDRAQNREKVRRRLDELLAKDKAKTTLNRISELGLIEMTRKRTRESLGRLILEPCFYCDGTGQLQSKQTIAYEILRQIRRERMNLPGYKVIVNAHPAVIDLLKSDERTAVQEAERLFQRRIELVPRKEYHLEQFDLQGNER